MKKGFTLVEILVSLLLLALGMVSLFNLFPLGLGSLSYSRRINAVSLLAQKKLEEIKSQKEVTFGVSSGKEGDLEWSISLSPLKLKEDIEVIYVQLDINFNFQSAAKTERFVTYLAKD